MKIAVYSDKFSGTLTASEVIETIKELFEINSIKASYFPVTDGGEDSTIIFKEYGIAVKESLKVKDLAGTEKVIQLLDISGDVFFESSLLVQYPVLSKLKRVLLENGAFGALVSGSGSAVFGVYDKKNKQNQVYKDLSCLQIGEIFSCETLVNHRYF